MADTSVSLDAIPSQGFLTDLEHVRLLDTKQQMQLLARLKGYFETLSHPQMLRALEPNGSDSPEGLSEFMQQWYVVMSRISLPESWGLRLWLHNTAVSLGHPTYTLELLDNLVMEMLLSGIRATRGQYLQLLESCYLAPTGNDAAPDMKQSRLVLQVMHTMYERGEPLLANDVIVTTVESLARSGHGPEAEKAHYALEQLLTEAKLPCMDEGLLIRLMDAYAVQENWDRFWAVWRIPPKFLRARSPDLYAFVYGRLPRTGHQVRCIDGVRRCFQEMLNEDLPVQPEGEVLAALRTCIRVADPDAERIARGLVVKDAETQKLARRAGICQNSS